MREVGRYEIGGVKNRRVGQEQDSGQVETVGTEWVDVE